MTQDDACLNQNVETCVLRLQISLCYASLLGLRMSFSCVMQTIGENLVAALQQAAQLQSSWADDFVSAEHLLQAVTEVSTFQTTTKIVYFNNWAVSEMTHSEPCRLSC